MNIANMDLNLVYGKPIGTEYELALANDEIGEGVDYINFVTFCRNLSQYDVVNLHISSFGGRCSSAAMICKAIEDSQATFIAHLNSVCWSAATTVALACDGWIVGDLVEFGLHSTQSSTGFTELAKQVYRVEASKEVNDRINLKYYKNLLDDSEIEKINMGAEITFFKEELSKRLKVYAEKRQAEQEALLEDMIPDLEDYSNEELEAELELASKDIKDLKSEINKRKKLRDIPPYNPEPLREVVETTVKKRKTNKEKQSATDASTVD